MSRGCPAGLRFAQQTLQAVRFRRRMPSERPDLKAGCSAATLDATSLQDFPARGGLPRTCCTESGTPQCRRSCPQLLSGLGIDGRRCAATKGGSRPCEKTGIESPLPVRTTCQPISQTQSRSPPRRPAGRSPDPLALSLAPTSGSRRLSDSGPSVPGTAAKRGFDPGFQFSNSGLGFLTALPLGPQSSLRFFTALSLDP